MNKETKPSASPITVPIDEDSKYRIPTYVNPKNFPHPIQVDRGVKLDEITEKDLKEFKENPKGWYNKKMRQYWFKYTKPDLLKCSFYTWNVSEKDPKEISIEELFIETDLIVISIQDIKTGLMLGENDILNQWNSIFLEQLNANYQRQKENGYTCLFAKQLGSLCMFMFSKISIQDEIQQITSSTVSFGTLGLFQQGAIAISCHIGLTSFLFVGCSFEGNGVPEKINDYCNNSRLQLHSSLPMSPEDHDYEIWMGDFDYRLNASDDIINENLEKPIQLIQYDQLFEAKANQRVFQDFVESPVMFRPTYKFIKNTTIYDWETPPAWSDRILFRVYHNYQISVHKYGPCDLRWSDHLPVRCVTLLKPRKLLEDEVFNCWHEIIQLSNELRNQLTPKAQLSTRKLNLGKIRPYRISPEYVKISNVGKIPISFTINCISLDNGNQILPSWLSIYPTEGKIDVNEEKTLTISIIPDEKTIKILRETNNSTIIQINIVDGSIFYIYLSFQLLKTSFGLSPKELINHPLPFVQLPSSQKVSASGIPKEFRLMLQALYVNRVDPNIFIHKPTKEHSGLYETILLSIDCCKPLVGYDIGCLSECLLLYLEAMGGLILLTSGSIGNVSKFLERNENTAIGIVRMICCLCKEISTIHPRSHSLQKMYTLLAQPLTKKQLDQNEINEVVTLLLNYTKTLKSYKDELTTLTHL